MDIQYIDIGSAQFSKTVLEGDLEGFDVVAGVGGLLLDGVISALDRADNMRLGWGVDQG